MLENMAYGTEERNHADHTTTVVRCLEGDSIPISKDGADDGAKDTEREQAPHIPFDIFGQEVSRLLVGILKSIIR
jgi:hypothetical protein